MKKELTYKISSDFAKSISDDARSKYIEFMRKGLDESIVERFCLKHEAHLKRIMLEVDMGMHETSFAVRHDLSQKASMVHFAAQCVSHIYYTLQFGNLSIEHGDMIHSALKEMDAMLPEETGQEILTCLARKWGSPFLMNIPPERISEEMTKEAKIYDRKAYKSKLDILSREI